MPKAGNTLRYHVKVTLHKAWAVRRSTAYQHILAVNPFYGKILEVLPA